MSAIDTARYLEIFRKELFKSVVPFWLEHSLDNRYGGYFNCLDRDGSLYDTTKYMWLQGRMVWMFSRLYNTVEMDGRWLEAAAIGADFIRRYGKAPDGRVYFSLTEDGRPVFMQRKMYSELFYSLALDEFSRATGDNRLKEEAVAMFEFALGLAEHPERLGRPILAGQQRACSLAAPMILLSTANQLTAGGQGPDYDEMKKRWVRDILLHMDQRRRIVLENVAPDGSMLAGSEGRLMNPGHAIEAGWFVLEHLGADGPEDLQRAALDMIEWSFERGWDAEYGGIYYFLDSENRPPQQLEWPMKLWWPLCEALYGLLLAWRRTGEDHFADKFGRAWDYIDTHFRDPRYGEWFGYLDRSGKPTHLLKGGPYKCFYHVPRALLFCIKLLEEIA